MWRAVSIEAAFSFAREESSCKGNFSQRISRKGAKAQREFLAKAQRRKGNFPQRRRDAKDGENWK